MQQHLKLGGDYYCWIVSQDKSADDTPENQLGDAENTSKDTSEESFMDNALEPGGAESASMSEDCSTSNAPRNEITSIPSNDTSEDNTVDDALELCGED